MTDTRKFDKLHVYSLPSNVRRCNCEQPIYNDARLGKGLTSYFLAVFCFEFEELGNDLRLLDDPFVSSTALAAFSAAPLY